MNFQNIKNDFLGGLSAAVITLPMSIAFGVMAFAPLGEHYSSQAAVAGIYAAVFAGFFAALFGGTPIQVTGPKASLALIITSLTASLASDSILPGSLSEKAQTIVVLSFFTVFLGGLFQLLFGILRLGSIIKFTPYPVFAGLMNGIGLLLIYRQIKPLLGLYAEEDLVYLLSAPDKINVYSLFIGVFTITVILNIRKVIPKIPAALAGVLLGALLYHFLFNILNITDPGQLAMPVKASWPKPVMSLNFLELFQDNRMSSVLGALLAPGIILGMLGSIESLLSSMATDSFSDQRHDSERELIGQGIGNIMSSFFGGISGGGSVPRSMASYKAGGRTRLAGMFSSLIILLCVVLASNLLGMIPLSVIAAVLVCVGLGMLDLKAVSFLWRFPRMSGHKYEFMSSCFISVTVTLCTIFMGLVAAAALGFMAASFLFVAKMGKTIVRRLYYADTVRSKNMRNSEEVKILTKEGSKVVILELQGPVFFGSADNLAREIDKFQGKALYLIVDLKRVNEMDSTGANIIKQIQASQFKAGRVFALSSLHERHPLWAVASEFGLIDCVGRENIYVDADEALEAAEDFILSTFDEQNKFANKMELSKSAMMAGMSKIEQEIIVKKMTREFYRKGDLVIKEGDIDRDLLILTMGQVSVTIFLTESNRKKRLVSYCPGITIGEIAFLDGSPRSADVRADQDSELYRLSRQSFEQLVAEYPQTAVKLVMNIAMEISQRLRITSDEVRVLEDI